MARQTNSAAKQKQSQAKGAKAASPKEKQAQKSKKAQAGRVEEAPRLFDERTQRDIVGVVFAVVAIVLFVAAVMPSDAVVTAFLSTVLHLTLGVGAYLLPFFLTSSGRAS